MKSTWNILHKLKWENDVAQQKDLIKVVELCNKSEEASSWEANLWKGKDQHIFMWKKKKKLHNTLQQVWFFPLPG